MLYLLLALLLLMLPAALDPDRLEREDVARRLLLDEPDVRVRACRMRDEGSAILGTRGLPY